jgi:hypothetical protein
MLEVNEIQWLSETAGVDIGTRSHIEGARPKENVRCKDCSGAEENRGRNTTESFSPRLIFGNARAVKAGAVFITLVYGHGHFPI